MGKCIIAYRIFCDFWRHLKNGNVGLQQKTGCCLGSVIVSAFFKPETCCSNRTEKVLIPKNSSHKSTNHLVLISTFRSEKAPLKKFQCMELLGDHNFRNNYPIFNEEVQLETRQNVRIFCFLNVFFLNWKANSSNHVRELPISQMARYGKVNTQLIRTTGNKVLNCSDPLNTNFCVRTLSIAIKILMCFGQIVTGEPDFQGVKL